MALFNFFGGGSGRTKDYQDAATQSLDAMRGVRNRYQGIADEAGARASYYQPQQNEAMNSLLSQLRRNTTNTDRAAYIGGQIAPTTAAYNAGLANLRTRRAADGDSSLLAGQEVALDAARAAATGAAASGARNYFDQRQLANSQSIFDLLRGMTSEAQAREAQGLGAATGLDQYRAGAYTSLAQMEQQRQAQQAQNLLGLIDGAADIWGMSQPGKRK